MNILKTSQRLEVATEMWSGLDVPRILGNLERLRIRAKFFENTWRNTFLVKLQALRLQLCQKINFITSIFQLICLPFGAPASKKPQRKEF